MDHLQPCSSLLPAWTGKYLWRDMEENIRNKAKCLLNFWKHQLHDATLSNLLKSSRNRILFARYHFKNEIGGLTKGLWGIPKGSGISHPPCIYRFICKEETVWCILLFRFYQNATRPTSPHLRSGQTGGMFQKHSPMDSSAEDPRPVLTLCRTQPQSSPCWGQFSTSLQRLHNENPEWIWRFYPHAKSSTRKPKYKDFWIGTFLNSGMQSCTAKCSPNLQPGMPLARLTCLTQWGGSVYMWCF